MTSLPALTNIANGDPASATPVDGNFDTLATFVDQELVNRDGSVAMVGELTLSSSTPSGGLVAASKGYVDADDLTEQTARFRRDTDITLTTNTSNYITFESETNDLDGWWSSGTTLTCPADGIYLFVMKVISGTASGDITVGFTLEPVLSTLDWEDEVPYNANGSFGGVGGDNMTIGDSGVLHMTTGQQLRLKYQATLTGGSGSFVIAQANVYITRLALI